MAGTNNIRAGGAFIELSANDSKLQAGLRRSQANLKAFSTTCGDVGRSMLAVSAAMAAPIALAVRTFAQFDDQMRQVKAVTNATGKDFEMLTEKAKKLGRETSFTASQVAEGMSGLGRMGFKPQEIDAAIPAVMNLARATGTDLGEASQIAANNLRVFGMEAGKIGEVSDIMAATANNSAQTLTDLGEALKMAGPKAAEAGQGLRETCIQLGILANMGIRGSMAGTALARTFQQMASSDVQNTLKKYGVSATDAAGKLRRMRNILTELAKATANLPNAEKIALFQKIFDIRGSLGGGILTTNIAQIDEMTKALENCSGVAEKTAKEMDSGIGGAFRELESAAEGVGICLGEIISKTLVPIIKEVSNFCLGLRDWLALHPQIATALAYTTAGIATFSAALIAASFTAKALSGGLTLLSVGIKAASAAMTLFTASNPIGWVLLAVGAIAGLCVVMNSLGRETRQTSNEMAALMEKNDQAREMDAQRAARLKQLAEKQQLTNAETAEAAELLKALEGKYGKIGAELDTMAGKLDFAAVAQAKLNAEMAKQKIADIDNRIQEHRGNIETAQGYNDTMSSYWYRINHPIDEAASLYGGGTMANIEQNDRYINGKGGQWDQIAALQAERRKWETILKGNTAAADGKPGAKPATPAAGSYLSPDDRTKAESELQRYQTSLSRERKTALENEIDDITQANEEYKKLLKTLLAYEKARPEKLRDNAKIAEYESAFAGADEVKRERITRAENRAHASDQKTLDRYNQALPEMQAKNQQDAARWAEDKRISNAESQSPEAAAAVIKEIMTGLAAQIAQQKQQYNADMQKFQREDSEGGKFLGEGERGNLDQQLASIAAAQSRMNEMSNRIANAQSSAKGAVTQTIAAFNADTLTNLFGKKGVAASTKDQAAENTAKATQDSEKHLRDILTKIDQLGWSAIG